jgi:hypothetical protein
MSRPKGISFGMQRKDDVLGDAFCHAHGLEDEKFICVIPRMRYTLYHRRLRDMIIAYVRNTGNKVLACAEMTYQVEMAKEVLVDPH